MLWSPCPCQVAKERRRLIKKDQMLGGEGGATEAYSEYAAGRPRLSQRRRWPFLISLGLGGGEEGEDAARQDLVILDVGVIDLQLAQLIEIGGAERPARGQVPDAEDLEARTAGLGTIGHQHEVEFRPLTSGELEHGARAPLSLDGDELIDRRPEFHLDEDVLRRVTVRSEVDYEVRGEVLAAKAEGGVLDGKWADRVARPPEDRLDECFSDPALGLEKVHDHSNMKRGSAI